MDSSQTVTPFRRIAGTELRAPSTDDLDLTRLPARLDDRLLARVKAIADSPLPALLPCDDRHFAKCLRVMLAVLPRQNTDAVGGELFVETYRRQLGHYCDDAISFLADKATLECKWFPTIAQCVEIMDRWRRCDEATRRQSAARSLASQEWRARDREARELEPPRIMTQDEVDALPPHLVKLGLSAGYLRRDRDRVVYNPGDAA